MLILRFMVVVASASLFDIAAQAQTVTMGETAVLSDADSKNGNLLVAQQATLTQSATIRSMAFYVTSADGQLVLGIYDATGPNGIPGHLVAQTAAFTPATGWNTSSTTTTPTLTAGKYWLVYLPSSDSLSFVKENTTGNCRLYSLTFTATLPQTYKRNPRNCTPTMWSLYATLSTTATPTLSLTDTPVNPTVMDSAPPGTQVTSLAAAWSDGSTFTGGYSFTGPYNNDNNLFTLNNNAVVVNGSLAQLGGKPPQNLSVVAQQGSTSSNSINVPVAVTTSPPPPPPPPPGNDPTSGVLPPYNDAYANWANAGMASVGGIPNRTTVCASVSPSGGDDFANIQNAINSCPAGEVVELAAGAFSVKLADLPIQIATGVTLRGAGNCGGSSSPYCGSSISVSDGAVAYTGGACQNGACPNGGPALVLMAPVAPDYNYSWAKCGNTGGSLGTGCGAAALTADAAQGQMTVQVASTTGFSVGQWVLIDEASGAGWVPDPLNAFTGFGSLRAAPDWLSSSGSPATGRVLWSKSQNNGGWDFGSSFPYQAGSVGCWYSYCDRPTQELHKIASTGSGTLTFDDPLTAAFRQSGGHNAQVYPGLYANQSGSGSPIPFLQNASVENLSLLRAVNGGLEMEFCANCWVKNVEIGDWYGGGIKIAYSARSELNGVYVHHCWDSVNNGGEYPISLDSASTEILVTNSITNFAGKGMVARAGGAGSVVSYNYVDDTMYDAESGIGDYWVDMGVNASHYSGPHHVLFEGNWGDNLDNDHTHGNSMYVTFFRNQGTGLRTPFTDPSNNKAVNDFAGTGWAGGNTPSAPGPLRAAGPQAYNYWFAFVGNVLGLAGETTAANGWSYQGDWNGKRMFMLGWNDGPGGQDPYMNGTRGSYVFRHGNYDYVNGAVVWDPNTPDQNLPSSFYLSAAPSFFSGYTWPWINPTGPSQVATLPAKARWDNRTPFVQP